MTEMSVIDEYRAYLQAKLEEAKAAIDYYGGAKSGEWSSKSLTRQWGKKRAEIQAKLHKEQIDPQEFYFDADNWERRNKFPIH